MKVLSIVVICCSIYTVNCYGPPPKSKKGRTTTTTTETAPTDDGIVFPDQENNVGPPVSYIQNNGVGSYGGSGPNYGGCGGGSTGGCSRPQGQPSYSPQGQQPQPSPQNPSYSPQFPQSHSPQSSYNPQGQQPQSSYNPQGQQPQSSYNPQYPQGQQTAPSPQQPTYNPQYPQGKPPPQSSYNPQTPQGQQPQQSYNPQGQQPQQPGGNYWWQGASSPFNPQQQPPSVPSQSPGNNIPPQNGGQAVPPSNHNQPSYVPTHSGPSHNHPAGGSPSKPIDIQSNPFLSSALAGNKPSSCGSYGGAACKPQAPNQGAPAPSIPASNQPIACNPGSYGSCNTGSPPHSPTETPLQPGSPTSPIGAQPVPPKPVDIGNNPFLSSALNKPSNGCAGSYSGNCGSNQQPNLSNPQGQNQYPATQQPQYPGSQTKPLHPGLSQIPGPQQPVQSQYPGSQQPGQPQGNPHYPGNQSPGQPSAIYPGSQTQPQGGQQYPNSQQSGPLANQQYPGGNQYPNGKQPGQGNQQSPESSYQGLPQGSPQKFPGSNPSQQPGQQGFPQPSGQPENPLKYPGSYAPSPNLQTPNSGYKNPQQSGQQPTVNIPGDRPQQYPNSPSQVKPSYPQYGSAPTPGQQYTPQFPSSGVPCNQPNQLCVTKSACQQGVLTQTGVPGRAGFCNTATEVCCKIPTGATPDKQAPPTISYGNRPGTNGVPIGGSIYDTKPNPSLNSVTLAPTQQPYTGPLNTTPYPGCPAALKCVPITYCTAEGVMADNPVYLTREQQDNRVPLTDCMNLETNTQGKCCRDPNYKDPWPAGMMMGKTPAGANFDDGQYHPPATDNGQYHPPTEQETSGTFSHEAGIYYNVPSSTPKGHTIKKPIGNFNQNPTAFPTKPAFVNGVPVRQPAPVHEKEFPEGVNPPSNEILPPNGDTNVPSSPIGAQTYQPGQPSNSIGGGSYNPTTSGQPKIPVAGGSYNPTPSGQPSNSVGGGSYSPTPSGQSTIPVGGGSYNPTPSGQPSNPAGGSSYNPSGSGYQPNINEPSASRPDQPANGQPLFQPNTQNEPKQPPNSISPSYQPGQPDSSYQPKSPANQQLSNAFPIGQPQPGSSCGIRHQAYSTSPEDAGFAEFPWQALVSSASNKTYICGAAIIADNAVITAAHCVEELRSKDIVIKAGEWKLLSPSEKPVQVRVAAAVARHPQFSIQTLSNDLAIIVISQGFTFDDHVDKICLPSTPKPTYDQSSNCVVTGWGRKQLKAPIPGSVLHKVDVKFIPEDTCESKLRTTNLGKYFILSKGFSCALPKNPSDLCKVDVGSPIACDRGDGHYELAGVNSWDVGCQTDQTPTISSNPDAEWIDKVINTPAEQLAKEEEKYFADKLKGESIDDVDIDQKPGFALGYGK